MKEKFTFGAVAAAALVAFSADASQTVLPVYGQVSEPASLVAEAAAALAPSRAFTMPSTTPVVVDFSQLTAADFSANFAVFNYNGDANQWRMDSWPRADVAMNNVSTKDADDWMIAKNAVSLKAGKTYSFLIETGGYGESYPSKIAVSLGTSATSASMTKEVIPETSVVTRYGDKNKIEQTFTVAADGDYYIGIHDISTKAGYFLFVYKFSITSDADVTAPLAPENLTVVPAADGSLAVDVKVKAPVKSVTDGALQSLTAVNLYMDGKKVHTWENPTPGDVLNHTLTGLTQGTHEWYAEAANSEGSSQPSATATAFVGVNVPAAPTAARAVRTANDGEVTISWAAPTLDKDGFAINPDLVSYKIMELAGDDITLVKDDVKGLTYTYQAVAANADQQLKQYYVYAKTSEGTSADFALAEALPLGKAIALPYADSFANGAAAHGYQIINGGTGKWGFYNSYYVPQDGDEGVAAFTGAADNDAAQLRTYNIAIPANIQKPILSFYYSGRMAGNKNEFSLLIDSGDGFKAVDTYDVSAGRWTRAIVALDAYVGKTIRVAFFAKYAGNECVLLDNLEIKARPANNLAILDFDAPKLIDAGKETTINVLVKNIGTVKAEGAKLAIFLGDNKVEEKDVEALEPEAETTVSFVQTLPVTSPEAVTYRAELTYAADQDLADNKTGNSEARVKFSRMAKVTDLEAKEQADHSVTLKWTKPSFDGAYSDPVLEDFEDATSWAKDEAKGWKFVDRDATKNTACSGIGASILENGPEFPGISNEVTSFFVLDNTELPDAFNVHSGNKALCSESVYAEDETDDKGYRAKKDDWAFSPELSGALQTLSFWARSTSASNKESLVILATNEKESFDFDDYTLVKSYAGIPSTWMKLEVSIPEGARRVAFNCNSNDAFELLIDDITYMTTYEAQGIDIVGYNVYRDGEKLNAEPLKETTYNDAAISDLKHNYAVTCVYNKGGESALSNIPAIDPFVSVDDVMNDAVAVAAGAGFIEVVAEAGTPVAVYSLDGRAVYSGTCEGTMRLEVAAGVYIVKAGRKAVKVVVR